VGATTTDAAGLRHGRIVGVDGLLGCFWMEFHFPQRRTKSLNIFQGLLRVRIATAALPDYVANRLGSRDRPQ
jgi:hypothetical protein